MGLIVTKGLMKIKKFLSFNSPDYESEKLTYLGFDSDFASKKYEVAGIYFQIA